MDTYRNNSAASNAQHRRVSTVRMANARTSAADRLRSRSAHVEVRERATDAADAQSRPTTRRPRTQRTRFMRYAADNRVVQTLYALMTGRWRFAFYAIVVFAVAIGVYFPVRDLYAAYRTNDILTRQLEVRETYNSELETQVDKLLSTEGIEEAARTNLGLVMPGEHAVDVIGIDDDDDDSSTDSASSSDDDASDSSTSDSSSTAASDDAEGASAQTADDADDNASSSEDTDAQDEADDGADADTDTADADASGQADTSSDADASASDASDSTDDAESSDDSAIADDDESETPTTSAEVEEAEEAVAEDAPWYIHVLDVVFGYQGVEGQTVSSTGA